MTKTRICVVCLEQYEAEIPKPSGITATLTTVDPANKTVTFDTVEKERAWKPINKRTSQSFLLVEGKRIECGFCLKCLERLK